MANSDNLEERAKESGKLKKEKPFTKVVVRRLPPEITQEFLIGCVSPLPEYDYMYIVKGDISLGENAFARAYINFVNHSDVFPFKEKFDNYVFLDKKGHEYPAVVEFASFQKIPRKRRARLDPKCGSIESDSCYTEFLESLKEQPKQEEKPEFSYQFSNDSKADVITTPLLDYVKQKRIDKQRIREERREERKRRDIERKKLRDDERKWHEPRSPTKGSFRAAPAAATSASKHSLNVVTEDSGDKPQVQKNKDVDGGAEHHDDGDKDQDKLNAYKGYKYPDKKPYKGKSKYDYEKKGEFKPRRDDYTKDKDYRSTKSLDYKRELEAKAALKKSKKYSERREERKTEAKKIDGEKISGSEVNEDAKGADMCTGSQDTELELHKAEGDSECKKTVINTTDELSYSKENDPREQRRIRNKDRPSMAIYRPGALSRRKQSDGFDEKNPEE